jgi:hypothetical protein
MVNVYSNTVNALSGSGVTSPIVNGIKIGGGTTVNVHKNNIYNLSQSGAIATTAGAVNGMLISAGTTVYAYNNFISELKAPAANIDDAVRGISVTSTTELSTYGVYNNTVYLNASSSGTTFGSSGIYHTTSTTSTTAALDLRNNIIANNSTAGSSGKTVAFRRSSANLANYASTSNNNDFYAGTPGAGNLIFYDGTNSAQTLYAYKTGTFGSAIAPRDANSVTELPPFVNVSTSPYDLRISTSSATLCEGRGSVISTPSITDDYFGTARYPNSGYPNNPSYSETAPDIGAHEFGGTPDGVPTITSFTPTAAATGQTVTITGTNFTGATAVSFGGTAATSFIEVSATSITAVVAAGTTGTVSVTTPGGTGTSSGTFTFNQTLTWTGSTSTDWNTASNWNPQTVPSTTDEVVIPNTTNKPTSSNSSIEIAKLTLNAGATLTIEPTALLKVNGDIVNNGQIIFKSDATGSGVFDAFTGTLSGSGTVTAERYIPAKRAFRFLSPSVTTANGSTIYTNWQENGGSSSGLGTHITGSGGATNGFDATTTNNPSIFSFNSTTGVWEAITNTNTNILTAGTPYRLMVRGDRTVSLATNTPTPTPTTLRATGALKTGDFIPVLNQNANGYSFIGNPYQAPLDIKAALIASTNMDATVVYYWDPTLNARGGYVTRNLTANTNDVTSSFNEYLQAGQAVFVKKDNTANAPTMTIKESHKSVISKSAGVFRVAASNAFGLLRVNLKANVNTQWETIEGTLAIFNDNYSWGASTEDANKFSNLDEEVSFVQDNTSLAIAMQTNPVTTDELPVKLTNTRYNDYQWQFELTNYNGLKPYLFDTQNNTYTQIDNNTKVPFTVNGQEPNRFKIVFQSAVLNTPDFDQQIVLYPNPAKYGRTGFYIKGVANAEITLHNLLGQSIPVQLKATSNTIEVEPMVSLSKGVYLVHITQDGNTELVKWIVE